MNPSPANAPRPSLRAAGGDCPQAPGTRVRPAVPCRVTPWAPVRAVADGCRAGAVHPPSRLACRLLSGRGEAGRTPARFGCLHALFAAIGGETGGFVFVFWKGRWSGQIYMFAWPRGSSPAPSFAVALLCLERTGRNFPPRRCWGGSSRRGAAGAAAAPQPPPCCLPLQLATHIAKLLGQMQPLTPCLRSFWHKRRASEPVLGEQSPRPGLTHPRSAAREMVYMTSLLFPCLKL